MKTIHLPTAMSVVAIILSVLSLAMQVRRDAQFRDAALIGSVASDTASGAQSQAKTPDADAAGSATAELEAKLKDASAQLTEKVARLERGFEGLNRLMRASGLDTAVPLWGEGPGGPGPLFEQLGKEAATRAQFEARREELTRRAAESRDKDYARLGAERYSELDALYKAARPGRGTDSQESKTKRTEALSKMVDQFPEAYATGVAVAEQALTEALDGNAGQVESYLQTLKESAQYGDIVTDQGVEALPNIQAFLARQYIDQNRVEEAATLLEDLSQNYGDSLIIEPTTGGPPKAPRTAKEIVDELRQQLVTSK
jgi:hypothetical protein